MKGVSFGNYHTYDNWGLVLKSKDIKAPTPKIKHIEVEGSDGVLDYTEFFGGVRYNNRSLSFSFVLPHITSQSNFLTLFSTIQDAIQGQKVNITLDDDPNYYYIGRVTVNEWKSNKNIGEIVIEADAEPWKYKSDVTRQKIFLYGKNYIDLSNLEQGAMGSVVGQKFEDLKSNATTRLRSKNVVYCNPSQSYTINIPDGYLFAFRFYDKNEILLSAYGWSTGLKTVTAPENTDSMSFYIAKSGGGTITVSEAAALNLQVEEGTAATEYEPFLQSKTVNVSLDNSRKEVIPLVKASGSVNISFEGSTIAINYSSGRYAALKLHKSPNNMTITGNGAVVFEYQEGGL